ncbi:Transmembrane transporter, major facilitator family [Marinobacterium lacunae]|uniref:Transmembrane transporter, major facilitator family n=1 Tax=Marinobacterium lacunae TaxID=1232683 RepID=A0A081FXA4_9GAMM|nr:MFS transporter [Marinobacterium lacunae]KEA63159.1 Transmembrane transporter, major facilitator family [Marinobacterium lacunae]
MSKTTVPASPHDSLITPVLIAGCIIILVSFSIRASFGLFQIPIAQEFSWPRESFSFAIALQNLFWGIGQPMFSALAEKYGDRKAIVAGAFCYVVGLVLSAYSITPGQHQLLEMLIGFGIAGTGFGVILAVVGRAASDKHRSLSLGIVTAAGSAGQIVGPPLTQLLLNQMPWQSVFIVLSGFILLSLFALSLMRVAPVEKRSPVDERMSVVIKRAVTDPTFAFIFIGFFSCGYQLAFITAHFPAFIAEMCSAIAPGSVIQSLGVTSTSTLGAIAIALIGVFNIGGTLLAGWLGNKYSRKYLLASIYLMRTIVAAWFIMNPITPESVLLFSIAMGALWLATVPLTSGLVAQIYGLRYMGTLYGLVFFSHQLGGFLGVWLGGVMYDLYANYTLVWWIGVGFGALSALIHLPIIEKPWDKRGERLAAA